MATTAVTLHTHAAAGTTRYSPCLLQTPGTIWGAGDNSNPFAIKLAAGFYFAFVAGMCTSTEVTMSREIFLIG